MHKHAHPHAALQSHHKVKHSALSPKHAHFIIAAIAPARASEAETGVPAAITIAQAILESAWGEHHIGDANNYFGVKAHKLHGRIEFGHIATGFVAKLTMEHDRRLNKDKTLTANFRSYADMTNSFRDHGSFLKSNPIYKSTLDAYAATGDAEAFARGLQAAGYATDPHYADKLISVMRRHNLSQHNTINQKPALP